MPTRNTGLEVYGSVDAAFAEVKDVLASVISEDEGCGAALCVYCDGRPVVDLWGGEADEGRLWDEPTVAEIFSAVKPILALAVASLVERGVLDLDAPVEEYWPEFETAGRRRITLRMILSHSSGINRLPSGEVSEAHLSSSATDSVERALCASEPIFEPGGGVAYSSTAYGWLLETIVLRVTGHSLVELVHEAILSPLAIGDLWLGKRPPRERYAPPVWDASFASPEVVELLRPDSPLGSQLLVGDKPFVEQLQEMVSEDEAHAATTARSLARIYAMMLAGGELDGVRVLDADTVRECTGEQIRGIDAVFGVDTRYGLGAQLASDSFGISLDDTAFGESGLSQSLGFADPVAGFAYAFIPRRARWPHDPIGSRNQDLIASVHRSLG